MRNVAITGVSGYVGTRLLSELEAAEEVGQIVGVDLRAPRVSGGKLRLYRQDINQPLDYIFRSHEVDTALHLVFILTPVRDRKAAEQVNVGGARSFLRACQAAGVKQVLYLSSTAVYGAHHDNPVPLTEESPLRPNRQFQYSWDKAQAEQLFQGFATSHPQARVAILRGSVVMGPNADNSVTRSLFKPAMLGVLGADPPMQFLHEDDLARLVLTVLRQERAGVYNVAGEGTLPYSYLAHLAGRRLLRLPSGVFRAVLSLSWALRLQSESPASGLDFIRYPWVASTEKVKQETGFEFRYSSAQAVQSFLGAKRQVSGESARTLLW